MNDYLSKIGGGANSGSAKPKEEREKMDRERGLEPQPEGTPAGAGAAKDAVGGTSNDGRTDQQRTSDAKE